MARHYHVNINRKSESLVKAVVASEDEMKMIAGIAQIASGHPPYLITGGLCVDVNCPWHRMGDQQE